MIDDEVDLVQNCLNGDEVSVRTFVDRFQGVVFGLCYRMLGQREDAEDVAQEVFLRVFRNLQSWDKVRPLKPWLLTITANRCRTALEKRSRTPRQSEFAFDLADDTPAPDSDDFAEELQRGLETLREEYRLCFVMFYQQELSCTEISQSLDCPEGTVKTWLHRARRELAGYLKSRGFVPETENEPHGI